jgi:hypothetical protein
MVSQRRLYTIFFWVIGNENLGKFVMNDVYYTMRW